MPLSINVHGRNRLNGGIALIRSQEETREGTHCTSKNVLYIMSSNKRNVFGIACHVFHQGIAFLVHLATSRTNIGMTVFQEYARTIFVLRQTGKWETRNSIDA